MTTSSNSSIAPYLNTTEIYPEDHSQRLMKQTNIYSNIANAVNVREIAIYDLQQLLTGQRFFDPLNVQNKRSTYRKVFQIGPIASGAVQTIAHGIAGVVSFTRMYGTCITDVVDFRPIPYVDVAAVTNQISLTCTATNLVIANGATSPNITSGIIVLEYLLN